MPSPIAQLLSRTEYAGDGVTTSWEFSFSGGYLDRDHVKAYTETSTGIRTPITIMPGDFIGAYTLNLGIVPVDTNLVIYRYTPKDLPIVDFVDGGRITEASLDIMAQQAVFIAAETTDIVNTSDAIAAGAAAASAAAAAADAVAAVAGVPAAVASAVAAADAAAASAAAIALPLATTSGGTGVAYADVAALLAGLNVPTRTGGGASGNWGINITGNAATASAATLAGSATANVLRAGDTMTGDLSLAKSPATQAAKLQVQTTGGTFQFGVESSTGSAYGQPAYTRVIWNDGNYTTAFFTNALKRMEITGTGTVGVGIDAFSTIRMAVKGIGATSGTNAFAVFNGSGAQMLSNRDDGGLYLGRLASSPYDLTTAVAANAVLQADGFLYRSTSSIKYKDNVRNYPRGLAEVMALRPVLYKSIGSGDTQQYLEKELSKLGEVEIDGKLAKRKKLPKDYAMPERPDYAGFIAEEVHATGMSEFVQYAEDGSPDALHYSHMVALLVKAVQEQQAQIDALKKGK